jgi:hypothetical protein
MRQEDKRRQEREAPQDKQHGETEAELSCFLPGNLPGNYRILPKTSDLGQSCGKVHNCGKITAFTRLPYLTVPYRSTKIFVSVPP